VPRPAAVIGSVERESPAAAAGIRPRDAIVAIDGDVPRGWTELEAAIREKPGGSVRLTLARNGAQREVVVTAEKRSGIDAVGVSSSVGWIGIHHERQLAVLAVPSPSSPAALSGLRSGDRVVGIDGAAIEDWFELEARYAAARGTALVRVARGEPAREIELRVPALGGTDALGVITAVIVNAVDPGTPAARAGLAAGDLLVEVDGHVIGSFQTFQDAVRSSDGRALDVVFVRGGETRRVSIAPAKMKTEIVEGVSEDIYRVGIAGAAALAQGAVEIERVRNPLVAVPRAFELTVAEMNRFLAGLGHIVSGRVGRDAIGGPIEIARQSKIAWDLGWQYFLGLFVLISINLGILNLLPIPVLDGGQVVMYTLEAALKERFTMRAREIAQTVGFALLMTLMVFALYNDITKHVIGFFRNL
jgi:regulator of sigma E protease